MAVAGYVKVYAKRKGRLPKQLRHARLPADAKARELDELKQQRSRTRLPVLHRSIPTRTSAQSLFIPPDIV